MISSSEFLQLLVSRGFASEAQSRELYAKYRGDIPALMTDLVREKEETRTALGRLWGDSLGVSYVDLEKTLFQPLVVMKIPANRAKELQVIPLYQLGSTVTVATPNPTNRFTIEEAQRIMGTPVSAVFAFPDEVQSAIEIQYQSPDSLREMTDRMPAEALETEGEKVTAEDLRRMAGEQAVVEFTRSLLLWALKERASDIHIEPEEEGVRIRFRIDGMLQERTKLEKVLFSPLVSRLKILANLDITEKRRPLDGRIGLPLAKRSIDFRFSSVPTIYGEKIVLRILGQMVRADLPDLEELFFSHRNLNVVRRAARSPHGIFFVTGPTGSGKSLTLYSALKYINQPAINIMTIEDPVEYRLPGINQIPVNPAVELNFTSALRAFLRQDPDVILLGEIRDLETAKIACEAALTGHLVLTTLHTNNSLLAIIRLMEIGVDPFLLAPSVLGAMAQRLVRRICEQCREKYLLPTAEIERLFIPQQKREVFFYRGKGCRHCNHTGYSGRLAIQEIFLVDDELRDLIGSRAPIIELKVKSAQKGFQPLRYDGLKKVLRGLTTLEEVERVTGEED